MVEEAVAPAPVSAFGSSGEGWASPLALERELGTVIGVYWPAMGVSYAAEVCDRFLFCSLSVLLVWQQPLLPPAGRSSLLAARGPPSAPSRCLLPPLLVCLRRVIAFSHPLAPRLASPLASPLPLAPPPHELPSSCPLRFHHRRRVVHRWACSRNEQT